MDKQTIAKSFVIDDLVSIKTKSGKGATGYLKTLDLEKNRVALLTGASSETGQTFFECTFDDIDSITRLESFGVGPGVVR